MSEGQPGSAGAMLRAAREQRGLHIAALAAAIKVAPRKLDALENDRWDELPDATFVRALAQTVCRTLKIDAGPVLNLLPPAGTAALESTNSGLNMPFHDRPGRESTGLAVSAIRPMIWAAALLMLAAVAVYFLPANLWSSHLGGGVDTASAPAAPAASVATALPASMPASAPASAPAALGVASDDAASAPVLDTASPAATAATRDEVPAASSPPPDSGAARLPSRTMSASMPAAAKPPAPAPMTSASAPAGASIGALQLRASGPSWVEVHDGSGAVLMSRTLQAGDSIGVSGATPLKVVVGNAGATQVVFRGHAVDLTPHTRDNVARFDLP